MKRYLIFYGRSINRLGGMRDCVGSENDLENAMELLEKKCTEVESSDTWGHVYDLEKGEIMFSINDKI